MNQQKIHFKAEECIQLDKDEEKAVMVVNCKCTALCFLKQDSMTRVVVNKMHNLGLWLTGFVVLADRFWCKGDTESLLSIMASTFCCT